MITLRKSHDRGRSKLDWLDSFHTFSFAEYYDPAFMAWGNLRVINEDFIQPGQGFGTHPHHDMEIITYVISGELAHKDSLGTGSTIKRGEIQRMSAGSGIRHSEFNPSSHQLLHLLQIWILPQQLHLKPSYEQKTIPQLSNNLILIASAQGNDHAVKIHQDIELYCAHLTATADITYQVKHDKAWVQLISGAIQLNDTLLEAGDAAAISQENMLRLRCTQAAELLLFDLA